MPNESVTQKTAFFSKVQTIPLIFLGKMWKEVEPEFVREALEKGSFQIIDLRTPPEYERHHIPGALLIPVQLMGSLVHKVKKDIPTVFVCEHANRSTVACMVFGHMFQELYNMKGGMEKWLNLGFEVKRGMDEGGNAWRSYLNDAE
ncbi:MAG: rhodanese-like domain-containing protein [Thermoprotei archaeon]